jgi:hypothetical protein
MNPVHFVRSGLLNEGALPVHSGSTPPSMGHHEVEQFMRLRYLALTLATAAAAIGATAVINGGSAAGAVPCSYYVSPTGSDTAAGTITAPWRTLAGARDRVRAGGLNDNLSADLGICLRAGRYTQTSTFELTEADSGSNGHKVVYAAYPGEYPVIDGGKQVTGWTQVAGKSYWSANVPTSSGFASYFRQLYVDGKRAQLATGKPIVGTSFFDDPNTPEANDGVVFPSASVPAYTNVTDLRLFQLDVGFKADYIPVVGITDDGTNAKIQLQQPYFQSRVTRSITPTNTFYVQNALQELNSAGEWYLDQAADKVYYYPLAGQSMATASAYAPVVDTLVKVAGASGSQKAHDIAFDGLIFEHGNWNAPRTQYLGGSQAEALMGVSNGTVTYTDEVPGTIWFTNTNNIRFNHNIVRKSGTGGVHLRTGAANSTVTGNRFYNLTAAAVIVGRWQDFVVPADQRTKNSTITNNVVHNVGDDYMQGTGISLINSYATTVSHNLVTGVAYAGIHQRSAKEYELVEGVDGIGNNIISYNKVVNGGDKKSYGMHDNGAFYTFGAVPGTRFHHNYATKVTTTRGFMSDNQTYQTRWDDNVAEGGVFLAGSAARSPLSVYAARNYTTSTAATSYKYFIFDVDGPPHLVSNNPWPAEAQAIINTAGLEAPFAWMETTVPSDNLADYTTIAATSGFPARPDKLWDGIVETNEVNAGTAAEGWVQYDFGRDYQNLTFRFQNDNGGTALAKEWKVQRWSVTQNAWVDIMPYQAINTSAQVVYQPDYGVATTKIRLYVKNTNAGGVAAAQEFSVTGTVK